MSSRQRSIVHPDHFVVAPEVLGLPLASPSRRLFAMLIDLLLATLLVKAGGLLLGVAAVLLLWRASASSTKTGLVRSSVRNALRFTAAIILFTVVLRGYHSVSNRIERGTKNDAEQPVAMNTGDLNLNLSPMQLAGLARPLVALRKSNDSAEVERAARKLLETAKSAGASSTDLYNARGGLIEMLGNDPDSSRIAAVDAALHEVAGKNDEKVAPDSLLRRYVNEMQKDSSRYPALHDSIKQVIAGTEIAELQQRAERLDQRGDSLQKKLDDAEQNKGIRSAIAGFAVDDLGVGFGWFAVYFTAWLALWRGQTPGKRVAGIRVVRLDGEPLGWWMSFERFGGYAASFSVGLMGFAQILWDKNRQSLHDKACETVVVRTS